MAAAGLPTGMSSTFHLLDSLARLSATQWTELILCLLGLYLVYLLTICPGE
jgi:hypothetical protein